jgi:hypothetical protein
MIGTKTENEPPRRHEILVELMLFYRTDVKPTTK